MDKRKINSKRRAKKRAQKLKKLQRMQKKTEEADKAEFANVKADRFVGCKDRDCLSVGICLCMVFRAAD